MLQDAQKLVSDIGRERAAHRVWMAKEEEKRRKRAMFRVLDKKASTRARNAWLSTTRHCLIPLVTDRCPLSLSFDVVIRQRAKMQWVSVGRVGRGGSPARTRCPRRRADAFALAMCHSHHVGDDGHSTVCQLLPT